MIPLAALLGMLAHLPAPVSGNFSADLSGPVDTRLAGEQCDEGPCIWGRADSLVVPIVFHPPDGYRVRVLSLRGDLTAWIKTRPHQVLDPGSGAGVLAGFQTTSGLLGTAAAPCEPCVANTPLYIQGWVTEKQPGARLPFDYQRVDTLLDTDNILQAKVAEFLNGTEHAIHLELTYTIQYVFEHP